MSILVVEDNPLTATVLETHLTKQGWVVLRASDGHAALALLEGDPDVELLITDIQMPGMDGLELLQAVRARPEWKTLPVLVATARASAELVTRAGSLGVRHLAVKPYNVVQLVQQIREVLRTQPHTLRPRQQVQGVLGVDETAYRGLLRGFGEMAAARQASSTRSGPATSKGRRRSARSSRICARAPASLAPTASWPRSTPCSPPRARRATSPASAR